MTRSIYKPNFINRDLYRKLKKTENIQGAIFTTRNRNTTITQKMIGSVIRVYNGMIFLKLTIANPQMVGHKLGEFVFTKRMGSYLHKKSAAERSHKKKQKVLAQQQSRKKKNNKKKSKNVKKTKKIATIKHNNHF